MRDFGAWIKSVEERLTSMDRRIRARGSIESIGVAAGQIVLGAGITAAGEGVWAERSGNVATLHVYVASSTGTNPVLTLPPGWAPVRHLRDIMSPTVTTSRSVLLSPTGVLTVESGPPALIFGSLTYVTDRT